MADGGGVFVVLRCSFRVGGLRLGCGWCVDG